MKNQEECQFVRLLSDGRLVLKLQDREQKVGIHGIEIPQPLPDLYVEIITRRLPRKGRPLRCIIPSRSVTDQMCVKICVYGWQDKSGDVWLDLATILLEEGLARVAHGEFPERPKYLQYEHEAHIRKKGIFSEKLS